MRRQEKKLNLMSWKYQSCPTFVPITERASRHGCDGPVHTVNRSAEGSLAPTKNYLRILTGYQSARVAIAIVASGSIRTTRPSP
jgi:hypothetical protein